MRLGMISAKYESNSAWGRISTGKGDPGGKSYGAFQIAIKTGTLAAFVKLSSHSSLKRYKLGSSSFDREWRRLAKTKAFQDEQLIFILDKHYLPLRKYSILPNTRAINEALFSMSVQHGRAKTIVDRAMRSIYVSTSEEKIISILYRERTKYVRGLRSLSSSLKNVLANRYVREERDVLNLLGREVAEHKSIPGKEPVSLPDKKEPNFSFIIVIVLIIAGLVLGFGGVL